MYKNTYLVYDTNTQRSCTIHIIPRPEATEIQLYVGGNPATKQTIGYFNHLTCTFVPHLPHWMFPFASIVGTIIAKQHVSLSLSTFEENFIKHCNITRLGGNNDYKFRS